jgi:phosphoribosylanthranilate isomerase
MQRLPFRIKICGVTTPDDAAMAIGYDASAIGLNFYAGSKRHVDPLMAQNVSLLHSTTVPIVGVFVNHSVSEIASIITHVEPTWVQLHGDEKPAVIKHVKEAVDLPVIRALRWSRDGGKPIGEYLQQCDALGCLPEAVLIDSYAPGQYGGSGQTTDWEAIARWREIRTFDVPLVLAGGLTPENVAEAIRIVRPDAVDSASGVEIAPGKKDPAKVKAFVEEAKRAFALIA